MPRTRRGDVQGGLYHLYPRGVNRQRIFVDQRDRFFFLKSLVTACRLGDLGVVAYVLMTNHVHLVVRRGEKELGVGMKSLLGRYAQHFNRRHGRCGHLFQNRFGSSLCDTDSYLMHLIRYVHANPVRASLASNEAEYPHSSHHWYAQGRWPRWAAPVDVLDAFGSRQAACRFFGASDPVADRREIDAYRDRSGSAASPRVDVRGRGPDGRSSPLLPSGLGASALLVWLASSASPAVGSASI